LTFASNNFNWLRIFCLKKHDDTALLHVGLGKCYLQLAQIDKAEKHLLTAYEIIKEIHGESSLTTEEYINQLAQLYRVKRDYEKALQYIKKSFDIFQELKLEQSKEYRDLLLFVDRANNLSLTSAHVGAVDVNAIEASEKALSTLKKLHKDKPAKEIAGVLNVLGSLYAATKNFDKAIENTSEALKQMSHLKDKNHPDLATLHQKLAKYYWSKKQWKENVEHLTKAFIIYQGHWKKNDVRFGTKYRALAKAHVKLDQMDKAKAYASKAYEIFKGNKGDKDEDTIKSKKLIDELLNKQPQKTL